MEIEKLTLEQVKAELNTLNDLQDKAFNLPSIEQYINECNRIWILKKPLLFQKYKLTEIVFQEEIQYGDLMTIEEFIACCSMGGFIDDDGNGNYANSTHESNIPAIPSMIANDMIIRDPQLTHVIWYNR
jgi:hypothetical protein